jgi:hypothetical protein
MSWDYADWMADRLSSEECCLSEAEAEAAEQEQLDRERVKKHCAVALLKLGILPKSLANQRFWR